MRNPVPGINDPTTALSGLVEADYWKLLERGATVYVKRRGIP